MELKELIHPLEVLEVVGNTDVEISGIQSDSRKVEKGFLFVAVRGTTVDGHDYIPVSYTHLTLPTILLV